MQAGSHGTKKAGTRRCRPFGVKESDPLEDHRHALPASDAQAYQGVAPARSLQLPGSSQGKPGP
jgi:hypothetical protein